MKIVAISAVKNEIDIMEACVRHTLSYVDHFVIHDNCSTDGTLGVLKALQAEGLPITLLEDHTLGIYQAERMTMMMKEYAICRLHADWVLPLDADEFIVTTGSESIISDTYPCNRPVALPWRNYMPDAQDDQSQLNPVLRMRHRFADACRTVKVLIPGQLAAMPEAALVQGSHRLMIAGQEYEAVKQNQVYLAHFPIRSRAQYLAKIVLRILENLVMPNRGAYEMHDYRKQFASLKHDMERFSGNYISEAINNFRLHNETNSDALIPDPMPYRGGNLRCTPAWNDNTRTWNNILSYIENLAEKYGILANFSDPSKGAMLEQCHQLIASFRNELDEIITQIIAKENIIQLQHHQLTEKEDVIHDLHHQLIEKENVIQQQHLQLTEIQQLMHESNHMIKSQPPRRTWRRIVQMAKDLL